MKATKHVLARMSQRGITKRLLDKVLELGDFRGEDKIVINRKIGLKLIAELDQLRGDILKIVDKGGVVLVIEGESLVTTYNATSFRRAA
ncbi:MAG: hypothetical protein EOM12_10815 [Verrucomicrobiae bacterium]|nr:hypothetical protein [Verrucomicrobiae bacterium]